MLSDPSCTEPDHALDATASDDRLRAARRVDWRFLLDQPEPDDVLIVGRAGPGLVAGLNAVAQSVLSFSGAPGAEVGLVVATAAATDAELVTGAALVRPGGWLVVERQGMRPRDPTRTGRALRAAGFVAVRTYAAIPDLGSASALVAVDGRRSIGMLLGRRFGVRLGRFAGAVASTSIGSSIVAALAPASVVVARRPTPTDGATTSDGWLQGRLAAVDPALNGREHRHGFDVLLLTPRFRASAHVVALAYDRDLRSGAPAVVIKAGRHQGARASLAREAHALTLLAASIGASGHAPRLLDLDAAGRPPFLVETGIAGTPLDPRTVRRDIPAAAAAIARFVTRLPSASAAGDGGTAERLVGQALDTLDRLAIAPDLVERSRWIGATLARASLPWVFEHGDLAHPNLLRRSDGTLAAIDWERAEPDGLPLHDLTMGLAYVAAARVGQAAQAAAQVAAVVEAFAGAEPWAAALLDAELDRLGVERRLRLALTIAPWVRTSAFLAERTNPDWLRSDRSIALWRAMLDRGDRERIPEPEA